MSRTWMVVVLAGMLCGPLMAQAPSPCVDVVLIVDENASMSPPPNSNRAYYDWLGNMAIALDADYRTAGVGNNPAYPNYFILVSFGSVLYGQDQLSLVRSPSVTATELVKTWIPTLFPCGDRHDGYEALQLVLTTLTFRPGSFRTIILMTSEDREIADPVTREQILKLLKEKDMVLDTIVRADFDSPRSADVLGVRGDGFTYLPEGGWYAITAAGQCVSGHGSTKDDYVDLSLNAGGAAWDLRQIETKGEALKNAFTDVKVEQLKPLVDTSDALMYSDSMQVMGHCRHDGGQMCWFWFEYRPLGSLNWRCSSEWFPTFAGDWFIDTIGGLTPDTDYELRARARNSVMTAVGGTWTVRTRPPGNPKPPDDALRE
jgi:hypothetical protein